VSEADLTLGTHVPGALEQSPFAIPSKKLVMWLFIASDAITFAALLFAYGFLRNATPDWPRALQFFTQHHQRHVDDVRSHLQQLNHPHRRPNGTGRESISGLSLDFHHFR